MNDRDPACFSFFQLLQFVVEGIQSAAIENTVEHQAYLRVLFWDLILINRQLLGICQPGNKDENEINRKGSVFGKVHVILLLVQTGNGGVSLPENK